MNPIYHYRTLLGVAIPAFAAVSLQAQSMPQAPDMGAMNEAFGEMVSTLSSQDTLSLEDYANLAEETLKLGHAVQQAGQGIPETAVEDALQAVARGEEMNPLAKDWETLRNGLEALRQKPPQQEQPQNQAEDNQEQQDGENQEQEQQDQGGQGSGQDQQQGQEGENSESESQEQEKQRGNQGSEQSPSSQQDQQQAESPRPEGENLGEMDQPEGDVSLDQARQENDMQEIGGSMPQEQNPRNAKEALALQQLEKVKQNDDPGKLHKLLLQADGEKEGSSSNARGKDW